MGSFKHYSDSLVEEVLTDVAESFFGTRKELDDMSDVFMAYVLRLQENARHVEAIAGRLNFIMVRRRVVRKFYAMLEVDPPDPYLKGRFIPESRPLSLPMAVTFRGRFIKLVLQTYDALHRASDAYTRGPGVETTDARKSPVYYNLVRSMCEVINEKVCGVREGMSPACVLQYAKKFDAQQAAKAKITGATVGEYARLDAKFECRPIDFEALELVTFPDLPGKESVKAEIVAFCKRYYPEIRDDVRIRLRQLRK